MQRSFVLLSTLLIWHLISGRTEVSQHLHFAILETGRVNSNLSFFVNDGFVLLSNQITGLALPTDVISASDGHLLWHNPGAIANPVVFADMLYTRANNGQVDAWRENDGQHLWSFSAPPGSSVVWTRLFLPCSFFKISWAISTPCAPPTANCSGATPDPHSHIPNNLFCLGRDSLVDVSVVVGAEGTDPGGIEDTLAAESVVEVQRTIVAPDQLIGALSH